MLMSPSIHKQPAKRIVDRDPKDVYAKRRRFYRDRDLRTTTFLGADAQTDCAVTIHAGEDVCWTHAGQLLLVALANQLVRFHRSVHFSLSSPNARLLTRSLCDQSTLGDEIQNLAGRIDPYGAFGVTQKRVVRSGVSFGVGRDVRTGLTWYLGFERSIGSVRKQRCSVNSRGTAALRGAGLAAILGAATAIKETLGISTRDTRLSAWNLAAGDCASGGPADLPAIDVGQGLMIGAGAVGNAVAYWMTQWGNNGKWIVVDGDVVELHNTNRCLLFFPDQTDWEAQQPQKKAPCLCQHLPNATPIDKWYHEVLAGEQLFDTVLVLANEWDVRTQVSWRNDPIQLQSTTARSWGSQLHRHIAGRDGCIRCRMADLREPVLACSTADTGTTERPGQGDAALPFLSAASGLMMVSALQRLQLGEFGKNAINTWRWDFRSGHKMYTSGISPCRQHCRTQLPAIDRARLANRTLWADSPWLSHGRKR